LRGPHDAGLARPVGPGAGRPGRLGAAAPGRRAPSARALGRRGGAVRAGRPRVAVRRSAPGASPRDRGRGSLRAGGVRLEARPGPRPQMTVAPLLLFLALPDPSSSAAPPGLTSVGRDVVVTENVAGRVITVLGNVRIDARIAGDVIVWGGDVAFGPAGSVGGNLSVFGGRIAPPPPGDPPVLGTGSAPGTPLDGFPPGEVPAPRGAGAPAPPFPGL